jgi:sugar lactone lactonase YvrE
VPITETRQESASLSFSRLVDEIGRLYWMDMTRLAWLGFLIALTLCGQSQVQTVAGGFLPNRVAGTAGPIGYPVSVATDSAGNCYFGTATGAFLAYDRTFDPNGTPYTFPEPGPTAVYRLDKAEQIALIAGTGLNAALGDGGPASSASIETPVGLAVNKAATALYIASRLRVRRVDLTTGTITTYVGGQGGSAGAGVTFQNIASIAVDAFENLFLADSGASKIWRMDRASGSIAEVTGVGTLKVTAVATNASGDLFLGARDGLYKLSAGIRTTLTARTADALAVDSSGKIYFIAEDLPTGVRAVETLSATGETLLAGSFKPYGFSGDGRAAAAALLNGPLGVAVDSAGNLFIADTNNARVRRVDGASATIQTVAGNGIGAASGSLAASATLLNPDGLAADSHNLYFCEGGGFRVRSVDLASNVLHTVTGTGAFGVAADGSQASTSPIPGCGAVSLDGAGGLDFISAGVRHLPLPDGLLSTLGAGGEDLAVGPTGTVYTAYAVTITLQVIDSLFRDGKRLDLPVVGPVGIALDRSGNLYIADAGSNLVYRADANGGGAQIVAGGVGPPGYKGDGGPATRASLNSPSAVAVDTAGNLFIADTGNHAIRRVEATSGTIVTLAGNGAPAFAPDGPASQNAFAFPRRLTLDPLGNLYVSDATNRIRRITLAGAPWLTVDSSSLSFAAQAGGSVSAPQTVNVGSSGAAVSFTATPGAAWISVTPATAQTGTAIGIAVNPAGLAAGAYTGTVTIASAGAFNSVAIAITLNLMPANSLTLNPASLAFTYNLGDDPPIPQTLAVGTALNGAMTFSTAVTVDSDVPWLQVDTASGTTPASIQVSVTNLDMLDPGIYTGTIAVTAPNANPASSPVVVQLQIVDPNVSSARRPRQRLRP